MRFSASAASPRGGSRSRGARATRAVAPDKVILMVRVQRPRLRGRIVPVLLSVVFALILVAPSRPSAATGITDLRGDVALRLMLRKLATVATVISESFNIALAA